MTYPVDTELKGYRVTEALITSSAGWVGFADRRGQAYHLKVLSDPKYPSDKAGGSEDGKRRRRLAFERLLADWQRKVERMKGLDPNGPVVPVIDAFRAPSPTGLAELIVLVSPRVPLADVTHMALSSEDKGYFMSSAAFALTTFHELDLVHSDIKAKNVPLWRTARGNHAAKLLDFDGSYFVTEPPENPSHDQAYVAPEVLRFSNKEAGKEVLGPHVDIFSLGVLFAEMWGGSWQVAIGGSRYPCEIMAAGGFDVTDWLARAPDIPASIPELIARMVSLDHRARPTARQVGKALTSLASKRIRLGSGFRPADAATEPGGAPMGGRESEIKRPTPRTPFRMTKPGGGHL